MRLLSASVAHELNNIVASLRGFIDLGVELAGENQGIQNILAEARVSAERTAALAADLEVLATREADFQPVTLQSLLKTPPGSGGERAAPEIEWDCAPQARVRVDPARALQAVLLLRRIASSPAQPAAPLQCRRPEQTSATQACTSCQAPADARDFWLLQPLSPGRLRALLPLDTGRDHLPLSMLRVALLDHAVHAAGGHLLVPAAPESLVLALPAA